LHQQALLYGGLDDMTEGKTCDEIAGIVDDYLRQGKTTRISVLMYYWANFLEKSPSGTSYQLSHIWVRR
jgi:hypothetical protein